MPLYEVYATKDDLALYLALDITQLPADVNRLLQRASELIKYACLSNIDTTNINHLEALKLAVCAQVEYWLQISEGVAIIGSVNGINTGNANITFEQLNTLAPRAIQYLMQQHLLYRGIKSKPQLYISYREEIDLL
jgi:hypothetical protein